VGGEAPGVSGERCAERKGVIMKTEKQDMRTRRAGERARGLSQFGDAQRHDRPSQRERRERDWKSLALRRKKKVAIVVGKSNRKTWLVSNWGGVPFRFGECALRRAC